MVSFELLILLGVLAGVLVLQPLIALVWVYLVYRLMVKFARREAEKAVDGRIEKATAALEGVVGSAE